MDSNRIFSAIGLTMAIYSMCATLFGVATIYLHPTWVHFPVSWILPTWVNFDVFIALSFVMSGIGCWMYLTTRPRKKEKKDPHI